MLGYRKLQVTGFTIDMTAQRPIAILKDSDGTTTFPLWLTGSDLVTISAELISREVVGDGGPRDLLGALLDNLGLKADAVIIDGELEDGYRAVVRFSGDDGEVEVPVQPAIALAASLKYRIAVEVAEESLSSSALVDLSEEHPLADQKEQQMRQLLENLNTADMGKFPM